jgi:hypothetical protein
MIRLFQTATDKRHQFGRCSVPALGKGARIREEVATIDGVFNHSRYM